MIREERDLRYVGGIERLFDPKLEIPEARSVPLPDLGGILSSSLSAKVAAAPLAGLLAGLGVIGVTSIEASLKGAHDVSIAFGLNDVTYRSIDLVALGDELGGRILSQDNALYRPGRRYFVAYAAAEARGIKVAFRMDKEKAARLALEVEELIKAEAGVDVIIDKRGYLVCSGSQPATFGLAVVQLELERDSLRFDAVDRLRAVRGEDPRMGGVADEMPNVLFGGPDGQALVDIDAGSLGLD